MENPHFNFYSALQIQLTDPQKDFMVHCFRDEDKTPWAGLGGAEEAAGTWPEVD